MIVNDHPISKWFLYGLPGDGKTKAAATWPKPMLIYMFDPPGKDTFYLQQGTPGGIVLGEDGTPWQYVYDGDPEDDKSQVLITLAYLFDLNPTALDFRTRLTASERFSEMLATIKHDDYATVVLDSITCFRDAVVRANQYKLNSRSKGDKQADGRQWYGAAANAIQSEVMSTMCYWMTTNVVVIGHVHREMDNVGGSMIYGYDLPGQLKDNISRTFAEVYRVYTDGSGHQALFQTRKHDAYPAQSHLQVPDPCALHYEALWGK